MTPAPAISAIDGLGAALGVVLAVGVAVGAVVRYRWTGPVAREQRIWLLMTSGVITLAAAVAAGQAPAAWVYLTGQPDPVFRDSAQAGATLFAAGLVLACTAFYRALVYWNRPATQLSDPGDWLNGAGAVLVVMAIGNSFIPALDRDLGSIANWRLQVCLAALGGTAVVAGTVVPVAQLAGLTRDRRLHLAGVALVVLVVPPAMGLFAPLALALHLQNLALVPAGLILLASWLPARPPRPRSATTQGTANGTLVVVLAGMVQLVLAGSVVKDRHHVVTVLAAIAVTATTFRFVQLVRDLEHLARSRIEARTDELTGVANRRALMLALEEALDREEPVSLMIIDLDKFKLINDRYGHAVGDALLREVSAGFTERLPAEGLLSRLGGDEFAVLLSGPAAEESVAVAHRLAESVSPVLRIDGRALRVRGSVGLAQASGVPAQVDAGEMLRRADIAMYQAKSGGGGVGVYDQALDARAREQLELSDDLRVLTQPDLADQQFVVHYQPQVRLGADGAADRVSGAEALVRWQHPQRGLLGPGGFIGLVEQNGLMGQLTTRVVLEAAAQWLAWQRQGLDLRISVNLSATCLAQPELPALLDTVLELGVDPARFVLEITETSLMDDVETAAAALHRLAERGFGISIDDYGTGYSALSYLNTLPATELKVDRSFTAQLTTDPRTAAIVAGTVELAHRLGLTLVVEGVEDDATLRAVRAAGADEVQGYIFGRPMPVTAFEAWLQEQAPGSPGARSASGAYVI